MEKKILHSENWIYASAFQKEKDITEKTHAHILHLRDSYINAENHVIAHIVFEDETIADIVANELVTGRMKGDGNITNNLNTFNDS